MASGGDAPDGAHGLEEALEQALASIRDRDDDPAPGVVDQRWLGIGLRLGLERPGHARHLLGLIDASEVGDREAARGASAAAGDTGKAGGPEDAEGAEDAEDGPDARSAGGVSPSLFLARSAALPASEMAARGPDVIFGWAAELTSAQVLQVGRVVMELLADGAPADLGRGLGLAWEGSARIPRPERDTLFRAFADLEAVVAGVLAGRDLLSRDVAPQPHGIGSLAQLFGARPQGQTAVAAAIDAAGEPGRRGLVALWNTWMAMRYRSSISVATFELLTRPWVSVVGRLPER